MKWKVPRYLRYCAALGLRAGMVAGAIASRTQQEIPNEATIHQTEQRAVEIVGESRGIIK